MHVDKLLANAVVYSAKGLLKFTQMTLLDETKKGTVLTDFYIIKRLLNTVIYILFY